MVKHIYAEEAIQAYIEKLIKKKKPTYGVIIGRMTEAKDFAVKLIRCPSNAEKNDDTFSIDNGWLAGSAVEVINMLPGGLCLLGIFAFAPQDDKMQEDLRQALYITHKLMLKSRRQLLKSNESEDDPLQYWSTLHFELTTGRPLICTQFDIRDRASAARPAEWKYQDYITRWGFVKTHLEIDETLYLNFISDNIKQQLKDTVNSYCDKISKAVVEIDGKMLILEELFDTSPPPQPGTVIKKGKKNPYKWGRSSKCRIFLRHINEAGLGGPNSKVVECAKHRYVIRVKGIIYACAYLHSKATVEDAINELKIDAIFSLYHRCEIVAEELQDAHKSLHENSVIVLPRRVGFIEPGVPDSFMYFDYVFEEESRKDCIKRIKDQFDTEVQPKHLTIDLEEFPKKSDINKLIVLDRVGEEAVTLNMGFHSKWLALYRDIKDNLIEMMAECLEINIGSFSLNIPRGYIAGAALTVFLAIVFLYYVTRTTPKKYW